MYDKQIHLLLIDNDTPLAANIKNILGEPKAATYYLDIAKTLDQGIGYITAGGINVVIVGYELFVDDISDAIMAIRTAAPGIPILLVVDQKDEGKIAAFAGETLGDYIVKEQLNSYVLTKSVRFAMERQVMMLELEQYVREFMSSEERFRNIIANNADAMVVLDMSMEVRFVNFAAEKLFQKQACELIGRKFEYPIRVDTTVELLVKQEGDNPAIAEMRAVLTEWEGKKAYLASLRDLTERKKAEEENKKLQSQLIVAEKLMSIGMLASGVAHEINNPLTIILGFSQILMRHAKETGQNFEQLKDIEAAALRCKKIVSQLLLFSRQEPFNFEIIDINNVIDNSLDLMGFQLSASDVMAIKKYQQGLPRLLGNMQQLEQVFINLMTNARDAMPGGGVIEISTRTASAAELNISGTGFDAYIEVALMDTGTGIVAKNINKIFDPFFTTKTMDKGTGLGLSVCKGIIDKHKGEIRVDSEPGKGTTFKIILPIRSDK
jgi:signal transduction histidine kinase